MKKTFFYGLIFAAAVVPCAQSMAQVCDPREFDRVVNELKNIGNKKSVPVRLNRKQTSEMNSYRRVNGELQGGTSSSSFETHELAFAEGTNGEAGQVKLVVKDVPGKSIHVEKVGQETGISGVRAPGGQLSSGTIAQNPSYAENLTPAARQEWTKEISRIPKNAKIDMKLDPALDGNVQSRVQQEARAFLSEKFPRARSAEDLPSADKKIYNERVAELWKQARAANPTRTYNFIGVKSDGSVVLGVPVKSPTGEILRWNYRAYDPSVIQTLNYKGPVLN